MTTIIVGCLALTTDSESSNPSLIIRPIINQHSKYCKVASKDLRLY
jgi:hypothetical protein